MDNKNNSNNTGPGQANPAPSQPPKQTQVNIEPKPPLPQQQFPQSQPLEDQPYGGRSSALPPIPPAPQMNPAQNPSASPPNQNAPVSPPPPPNLSGSPAVKILLGLFIALILVSFTVFGSGVALAYNNYKLVALPKPLENMFDMIIITAPIPKTERLVLEQMQIALKNTKTATLENTFEFQTDTKNFPIKSTKITVKGPVDFQTSQTPKSQFDISGSVSTEGLQLSTAGSIIQVGDNLYFKVTEIPGGSFAVYDQFKNQWFFLNTKEFQNQPQDTQKQQEFEKKMMDIAAKYIIQSSSWSTMASSQNQYIVTVKPPKEVVNNFIYDVSQAVSSTNTSQELEKSIQKDNLKQATDAIQNFQITLNISKNTYQLEKFETNLDFKMKVPSASSFQTGKVNLSPVGDMTFKATYTANLTDYNKQIIIEPPSDAKDFKAILENIFKGYMGKFQQDQQLPSQSSNTTYVYWVHSIGAVDNPGTQPNPTQTSMATSHTFNGLVPNKTYSGVICSPDCNGKVVWTNNVNADASGSITLTAPSSASPPAPIPSTSPAPQNQTFQNLLEPSPVLGQNYVPWDLEILKSIKLLTF